MTNIVRTLEHTNLEIFTFEKCSLRDNPGIAWGAREVAAIMYGVSTDAAVNSTRRRRVFRAYRKYREACAEATARKRPAPPNPLGWIVFSDTNRIVLSIPTYRAHIASQLQPN
ncbi:hypothetical protein [Bradyrhizobium sp. CCGUVB14]|uniref:hypothetical protein n=1 Tax=Bradyrhizobium sp. CCGUVB14 TaxID=2949628 RepID=UPI0020B3C041|nr:hypothetical protein [Bradyrhizobium sp. CCGUVB14]MCP3447358.1 hypothetical protein [Bradyrhizobium sp. CCGUVB14]